MEPRFWANSASRTRLFWGLAASASCRNNTLKVMLASSNANITIVTNATRLIGRFTFSLPPLARPRFLTLSSSFARRRKACLLARSSRHRRAVSDAREGCSLPPLARPHSRGDRLDKLGGLGVGGEVGDGHDRLADMVGDDHQQPGDEP